MRKAWSSRSEHWRDAAAPRRSRSRTRGNEPPLRRPPRSPGSKLLPVPVDDLGIDVARLDATGARAVVVTPAHQWPSGVVLAPERRLELVAWAVRRDATIIEDDYDAEFRYDREPVGCLQGLAADRVISIGTVSKSLAPSLRLGWMVCPARSDRQRHVGETAHGPWQPRSRAARAGGY